MKLGTPKQSKKKLFPLGKNLGYPLPVNPPQTSDPLQDLLQIAKDLRSPDGCPWDKEQTHQSVLPHLLEECYEVFDAVDAQDEGMMREELGDLLFQVVFHAQLASERGSFRFQDVAKGIAEKLIRRHPHVYGESSLENSEQVKLQWDQIKAQEKNSSPKSVL